ncbi:hypothetical protein GW17_00053806 [Ensete ventricosum]|nr:hypothetical protein GW17_00053806 [Ensete ventricosum]RZS16109.1 hypothetical protein BHM03_00048048 [Ensete ventricosum]
MHLFRFPNNGIRAKAARRRGGQPPCRAGHPWPGHGQGPLQGGGRLRLGPACKGGQRRSQGQQSTRATLAGTPACSVALVKGAGCWVPVASPTASRCGGAGRRGGRPLARAIVTCVGAATTIATMQMGQ